MARKTQPPPKSFEDGVAELERIVTEIEEGKIGLEESLLRQERAQFLLQYCTTVLDKAERQIQLISKSSDAELQSSPLNVPGSASNDSDLADEESVAESPLEP